MRLVIEPGIVLRYEHQIYPERSVDFDGREHRQAVSNGACLRFIEVKGRAKGATTVTISKNEILTGLNRPEEFILAIVEVDGTQTRTVYLREPFKGLEKPSFMEVSRNLSITDLIRNAEIVYQE